MDFYSKVLNIFDQLHRQESLADAMSSLQFNFNHWSSLKEVFTNLDILCQLFGKIRVVVLKIFPLYFHDNEHGIVGENVKIELNILLFFNLVNFPRAGIVHRPCQLF